MRVLTEDAIVPIVTSHIEKVRLPAKECSYGENEI